MEERRNEDRESVEISGREREWRRREWRNLEVVNEKKDKMQSNNADIERRRERVKGIDSWKGERKKKKQRRIR